MKLLVTGGTGFIGSTLCRTLAQHGHELLIVSRASADGLSSVGTQAQLIGWDALEQHVDGVDGVVHLAGEPIAAKRWSAAQKALIRDSRVGTTRRVVQALANARTRPAVLVSASAIGYYGPHGDEPLNESAPPGIGFLAETCREWEAEAQQADALGLRVVRLRLGVVLGPGGGALAKMAPPFRAFMGGPLGSGAQWMSWVHRDDVMGLIEWALTHTECRGAVNATSPNPATMREFCRTLGRVLRRPSWAPVPAPVLRLLLGEMAEMLLTGQRAAPDAALHSGYVFRYPELSEALAVSVRP